MIRRDRHLLPALVVKMAAVTLNFDYSIDLLEY